MMRVSASLALPMNTGCYAIHSTTECLYVGSSGSLLTRVATQEFIYRAEAARIDLYYVGLDDLVSTEERLIELLRPRDNGERYTPGGIGNFDSPEILARKLLRLAEHCRKHDDLGLLHGAPIREALGQQFSNVTLADKRPMGLPAPVLRAARRIMWDRAEVRAWAEDAARTLRAPQPDAVAAE